MYNCKTFLKVEHGANNYAANGKGLMLNWKLRIWDGRACDQIAGLTGRNDDPLRQRPLKQELNTNKTHLVEAVS